MLFTGVTSTLPQCGYQCSNPTCDAILEVHCDPPLCQVCHNDTGTPECTDTDQCSVACGDPPIYIPDQCPQCETTCPGTLCDTDDPHCVILCEATACSWKASRPKQCPKPVCVPQCEEPACAYSGAGSSQTSHISFFVVVVIILLNLCL
jgi:hypothetical protein